MFLYREPNKAFLRDVLLDRGTTERTGVMNAGRCSTPDECRNRRRGDLTEMTAEYLHTEEEQRGSGVNAEMIKNRKRPHQRP